MTAVPATGPAPAAAGLPNWTCPRCRGRSSPTAWRSPAALALLTDRLDGELHAHAKADPRVKALRTLPGVGEFTALVMVAEIGDISRFPSARKLASWAGLTPTVRGSDLHVRHGHISKQGSAWLRWVMNQAAQTAKRSPEFAASYTATARRRGKKIATIAIARKLLTRAWHLLSQMQAAEASTPLQRS
jgi:transposase